MPSHAKHRTAEQSQERKARYDELRLRLYKELRSELVETTGMRRSEIKYVLSVLPRKDLRELRDLSSHSDACQAETLPSTDRHVSSEGKPWPSIEPISIDLEAIKFEPVPLVESSRVADFRSFAKSHPLYVMPMSPPSSPTYLNYLQDLCEYAIQSGFDKQIRQILLREAQRDYGVIHSWLSSTDLDAVRAHRLRSTTGINQQKSAEELESGPEERNKRKRVSPILQHEEPERRSKATRVEGNAHESSTDVNSTTRLLEEYVEKPVVDENLTTKPGEERRLPPAYSHMSSPLYYPSSSDYGEDFNPPFLGDNVIYGNVQDLSIYERRSSQPNLSATRENSTTNTPHSEVQVAASYRGDDSHTQRGGNAENDESEEEMVFPPERYPSVITSLAARRMNWLSPTGSAADGDLNPRGEGGSAGARDARETGRGTIRPGTDENEFPPSSPLGPLLLFRIHGFSRADESGTTVLEEVGRKQRHLTPKGIPSTPETPRRRTTGLKSTFFAGATPSKKRSLATSTPPSCIPFPPLSSQSFGLIQEKLADDPFRLLMAVILLNRTRGAVAIPIFYSLVAAFPTIESLATAHEATVCQQIKTLGLHNQRASTIVRLAHVWLASPPTPSSRTRTLNYPSPGDGRDVGSGEVLTGDDPRIGAFEIAHLPGVGAYALDSWRIFCRDQLRGLATGWNGEGADSSFEPEWKRVVPTDKELRAFLRWCWLREGWDWDPLTGEKEVADTALLDRAARGDEAWLQRDGENAGVKIEGVKYRMSDVVQIDDIAAKIAAVWER